MRSVFLAAALTLFPLGAQAYVGPGAGLGAIAITISVLLGLVLLVVGFLWYPLKRMIRSRKGTSQTGTKDAGL